MIGAGGLGYHHVRILREMQGPAFAGFFDARTERAEQVARELGVTAHPSLESLLDVVDAVTIVVPTPAHFAVAREVLGRGIHALIEKPIATTLDEADEMLAIARANGALVQTGHVERFNRAIRAALPYVDAPRFIESDRLAPFVDIANARLTFESGAVANITASRVSRERMRKLRIFQQSGYLSLDLGTGDGEFFRLRGDVDFAALAAAPLALEQFVERIPLRAEEGEPLRLEFESFLAAVRGEVPVTVTGEAGREALAVALQIVADIERSLPSLSGRVPVGARA